MKRRNFLSGLMASPLALKARVLALFARKPVEPCDVPILRGLLCTRPRWHKGPHFWLNPKGSVKGLGANHRISGQASSAGGELSPDQLDPNHQVLLFIKKWNEWAKGKGWVRLAPATLPSGQIYAADAEVVYGSLISPYYFGQY